MTEKRQTLRVQRRDIQVSNLEKILYPAGKFTKGQVIDYYVRISEYLLPHLKDRPCSLKRYPDGVRGKSFWAKDAPRYTPEWVQRFSVPRRGRTGEIHYILINDLPTLVWVANAASLELHPFLHRAPRIEYPTSLVFDLDPGKSADILTCIQAAFFLRELLDELNLTAFAKVSGSKGLQVYVPLNGELTYAVVKPFAKTVAAFITRRHPGLIVANMSKNLRSGKVFIDWSQNSEVKTTVAAYSLRTKQDRPYVSMPVDWDEVRAALRANNARRLYVGPQEALKRAKKTGDLFAPVESLKQTLPPESTKLA
jgi:bifunctional non-homologous end joining protein LigD